MDEEMDFFTPDQYRLDYEWIRQPGLVYKYAKMLADAHAAFEQSKSEKELVSARLASEVRRDWQKLGLEKITDDVVKCWIPLQADYQSVDAVLRGHKRDVEILQAAVQALEHRKKALENLVVLQGRELYASPQVKPGNEDVFNRKKWRGNA